MSNLLEQLEKFAEDDPDDPFNHYALALEYLKSDVLKAQTILENLVDRHSSYVPTYYQLAHLYVDQGKIKEAQSTFERGIIAARAAGDLKAMRELQSALSAITDE